MRTDPRLIQLANLLVLAAVAGAGAGCRDSSASSTEATESTGASPASSAEVKDVVLAGVDTSPMTPRERHAWSSLVTSLFAPCAEVPVSVAQCVQENRACGGCVRAAKWVARAVRDGASESQIEHSYKDRFDPSAVKILPLDGSPTRGPDDAPVTIFELADFECPHCREAVSTLDAVMAAHPGKVRLVYKSFTLPFHVHGEPAARAAFAAGDQGKFWEMEHLLFERQEHLEDADLERYAGMLKLDIPKWKADMASAATTTRINDDHKLGEDLKLKGTPTIYIDGRELDVEEDESLEDRVATELGTAPAPAAAPASAAAAPSAVPS
ncbi:MAG TPA: thioredoxin domain-containing protein, partial [Polyangiaceae bacterium]|nr:thioredoxin domain-containing protein [Polyangiaceae bacterium]